MFGPKCASLPTVVVVLRRRAPLFGAHAERRRGSRDRPKALTDLRNGLFGTLVVPARRGRRSDEHDGLSGAVWNGGHDAGATGNLRLRALRQRRKAQINHPVTSASDLHNIAIATFAALFDFNVGGRAVRGKAPRRANQLIDKERILQVTHRLASGNGRCDGQKGAISRTGIAAFHVKDGSRGQRPR